MKTVDTAKAVQMLQHIYDMLETADDPDDIQEVQRAVHSYLEDLQPNTPIRITKAGEEEEASILGELPDLIDQGNMAQAINDVLNQPEDDHFGEEQAEGLDNLLEGLKDGPKDERW